jgi:hypothetical protein
VRPPLLTGISPRPKPTAAGFGLGHAAIDWKIELSTDDREYIVTQGGAARLASLGSALG